MAEDANQLLVVWTSADREVAENMVFMYSLNSRLRGWWEAVTLLVWGPSQRLLVENAALQAHVARMREAGVRVIACRACADRYGLADQLRALGVEVYYTGEFLTDWCKSGARLITF